MIFFLFLGLALLIGFCLSANAVVLFGGGVAGMRGSIGGTTFSHSKAGNYARNRTKPVNPRSPLQNARRATVAHLTKYWSNTLSEQERKDWIAYAKGTTFTNKLGQVIEINGLAAFLRLNALLDISHMAVMAAAPTAMGHAGGVSITFAAQSNLTKFAIEEPGGAFDKTIDKHIIWFFTGLPTEPGRIATPKGFKYLGAVSGNSGEAPGFPTAWDGPYTMRAGQFITIRAMFSDEHRRVSGPFWAHATAAPSG